MAHSIPAGPAPTTSNEQGLAVWSNCSGCQPRRYSSPEVGFCVQDSNACCCIRDTHRLQPIHSRMSSGRPAAILAGRNGSAMLGRAAPMMSHWPRRSASTMSSGLVNRPLLTTGTAGPTMAFTCDTKGRILAPFLVVADLDGPEIAHALAMHQLDEMQTFVVMLNPEFAVDRIGLETRRDRQAIAHGTLQRRHDLDVETRAIGE